MTARKHATPIAWLFTAGALAMGGFAEAPADPVELQAEAPLQLAASAPKWPNGIVNTCWTAHAQQHTNSSGVNDFATLAQLVQGQRRRSPVASLVPELTRP